MIGCYHCDFTRKTYPLIRELVEHFGSTFIYVNFPTKESTDYFSRLSYCVNREAPDKFWQFNDAMFSGEQTELDDPVSMKNLLENLGIDPGAIDFCTDDLQTKETVQKQLNQVQKTNFYGTPTVFINDKAVVGPKPYRVYAILLKGLLFWLY